MLFLFFKESTLALLLLYIWHCLFLEPYLVIQDPMNENVIHSKKNILSRNKQNMISTLYFIANSKFYSSYFFLSVLILLTRSKNEVRNTENVLFIMYECLSNNQKDGTKTKLLNKIRGNVLRKICYNKKLLIKLTCFNI